MSTKQTLEERLKKTVMAMRRTEPDSGIDLCHIVAVEEAIDRLAKFAAFADEKGEPMKAILTADGKLITQASPVWWWDGNVLLEGVASMSFNIVFSDPNVPAMLFTPNAGIGGVYSTKQAAEAAKEKQ